MGRRPSTHEAATLTPLMFQILLAVSQGERHGYAIMQEIEGRSEGAFTVGAGTLYRSLKQLVDAQLISEGKARPKVHNQRRYYRLTASGRRRVAAEAKVFHRMVMWAEDSKVLGSGGT